MKKQTIYLIFFMMLVMPLCYGQQTKTVWLDDLDIQLFAQDIRPVSAKQNYAHNAMQVKGKKYERGVGVQTISILSFLLDGHATRFSALVGMDDSGNKEVPVNFYVIGDRKILFESGEMRIGDEPIKIEVDLRGIKRLGLLVTDKKGGINNKRTYSQNPTALL